MFETWLLHKIIFVRKPRIGGKWFTITKYSIIQAENYKNTNGT